MEFNKQVKRRLFPILEKYGFKLEKELENILMYKSKVMEINLVLNQYDNSHLVEIGRINEILYPLNNNIIKYVLGCGLNIESVTSEEFLDNLFIILNSNEGGRLLLGDITSLKEFIEEESRIYTFSLLQQQALNSALTAWDNKDYKSFVRIIDELDIKELPNFYNLKYYLAKKRLLY